MEKSHGADRFADWVTIAFLAAVGVLFVLVFVLIAMSKHAEVGDQRACRMRGDEVVDGPSGWRCVLGPEKMSR